jgi:triacylglycerol lipase
MPAANARDIQQSLDALKQNPALSQKGFANVVQAFAFHPEKGRFLLEVNAINEKLAETLLIFRKTLAETISSGTDLANITDHLFLHYVINTDGPILDSEGSDDFDVYEAACRYAKGLSVAVSKDDNGIAVLHIDGKELPCAEWLTEPGLSAAWSLRSVGPVINKARYGRNDVIPSAAFRFNENAAGHSLENAMILSDFSHLAYFTPSYIQQQMDAWGYLSFKWIEDTETDTQVFLAAKQGHIIICFRGTSSGKDILADLNFFKTGAYGGHGKVHRGFQHALDSVWDEVQAAVNEMGAGKKLFFCGHSLGAALAQLAAHRFALAGSAVAHVYVFGSPRVANREFRDHYNELLAARTFLHINNKDIVTTIPLALLGFHHLGGEPRSFNNGHVITNVATAEAETTNNEMEFDQLDAETQEMVRQQMFEVEQSIQAATKFLTTDPNQLNAGSYGTVFDTGAADEHCMDQYLFKFACAIVDAEWAQIGGQQKEQ